MKDKSLPTDIPRTLDLPLGLQMSFDWIDAVHPGVTIDLCVPDDYHELSIAAAQPEVLAIQRLLTLARRGVQFRVLWEGVMVKRILTSASIYPLLSVLLSIDSVQHIFPANHPIDPERLKAIKKAILRHQFSRDLFSDSEIVVCKDRSEFLPLDFYSGQTLKLRPREDFETLVVDALSAQSLSGNQTVTAYKNASALGVVVAELFENTDMHGRLDVHGKLLSANSLRGVIFKRIRISLPIFRSKPNMPKERVVDCFEVSVFDSGVGYFSSYTKRDSSSDSSIDDEWKILHNCLERHYYPNFADNRAGHRAMGLFEVLRAIQSLKARIEVRTGRLYAYRTFLDGELQAQMRPRADFAHFSWPEPRLLDVGKKYVAMPSQNEPLIGSSIRIVVPLN